MNQMELNAIREVVSSHKTMVSKFDTYASQCQDPEIKKMFQQGAKSAQGSIQTLINML